MQNKKAVVLLSGGLDSAACLYWALNRGYKCFALNILYGQRHAREAVFAKALCKKTGASFTQVKIALPWLAGATSLVGGKAALPDEPLDKIKNAGRIPSTYVPARNLVFMSLAASLADSIGAAAIIAGPNAVDFSGYPDCRPQFYKPLAKAVNAGTRAGAQGRPIKILTPLLRLSKARIAKLAARLGVPFEMTWTCYKGGKKPCGRCDACKLRAQGFKEAGLKDGGL
jgi:7-cyano-7-deazaguanine synthase